MQELIDVLKVKLHGYKYSFSGQDADLIKILNAAKHHLWFRMVAAGRDKNGNGNWFIKSASINISGNKDIALPSDFHDLAFVESTTAGWEGVQFKASDWYKQVFQEQRRQAGTATPASGARFFVVSGGNPATFSIDRLPSSAITLNVFYTYVLPEWTAAGDDISYIPTPYRDALVSYCTAQLIATDQDPAISQLWTTVWAEQKELIGIVANERQIVDIVTPKPYDNSGG